jgi:glutathionyl-hydroquinone reductase
MLGMSSVFENVLKKAKHKQEKEGKKERWIYGQRARCPHTHRTATARERILLQS